MALKDRLLLLIENEGLNPNQFYVKTGLGNGFLNTVGEKLRKPSVEKIERVFPHWNIDYIQTGKGEMLKPVSQNSSNFLVGDNNRNVQLGHGTKTMHVQNEDSQQEIISELEKRIIFLEGELKAKDKEIEGLQSQLAIKTEMITFLQNHNKK